MVLVARLDDGRTLYAVEREDRGLYVLCKIGSWVNVQQLKLVAAVQRMESSKSLERGFAVNETHNTITIPTPDVDSNKAGSKKRLAIEAIQSMVRRPPVGLLPDSQSNNPGEPTQAGELEQPVLGRPVQPHNQDIATLQPTAAEIFDNVRLQYFDALYLSKVRELPLIHSNLTLIGFFGILCKGSPLKGPSGFPP